MIATFDPQKISDAISRACAESPFLSLIADREADLLTRAADAMRDPLAAAAEGLSGRPIAERLRLERRRLALLVALGDLSGTFPLETVVQTLSDFADRALDAAIRAAILERTPDAEPVGFTAIALGKQGSRELNYSSDIDPIFLFDPATLPHRPREEPQEAAVRIGKRVVELLQARDGNGYVLRVDLRLRPSSEVTPIALPVDAAIGYYESAALPWERAAFIRARACAGDIALGERFLSTIRPFVWRRSLDFGAVAEIRGITARIRDHHHRGQAFGPGYDLKRGRGGIREIEFFAQIHQLIHGGRDPVLRAPATLDALERLASAGWIARDDAMALSEAYRLLRTLEHRVQMIDDRQTHALPPQAESLDRVARLHGLANGAALLDLIRPHVERVGAIYDAIEPESADKLPDGDAGLSARLADAGFVEPDSAVRRVAEWRAGAYPALRSAPARAALEDVLPGLIAALGQAPDPDAALLRLDKVLAKLPSAINFFRLIDAQPHLARLLATVLSLAPTLADALGRRVEMLDGLIDASALEPVGAVPDLVAAMCAGSLDYEQRLDHVRRVVAETRFALGVQIVAGVRDPLEVAGGYARLAEASIEALGAVATAEFERTHGRLPDGEMVILALGRLGGGALTHASDLDLIYVFTGDHASESDGKRPLGASHYYNRLAQRVTAALSVPTASGPLYPVDTRLRPSGNQGPLVVSLEGFRRYQRESAWTWEHMALTRARPVFGSAGARAAVQAVVDEVLSGDRPERDIAADATKMRAEMRAHKPSQGPLDAKLLDGGLVDLEFAVHVRQLIHRTALAPDLPGAIRGLAAERLIDGELIAAHDLLTRLIVTMRLVAPDAQVPPPATRALVARALGLGDWDAVMAALDETRAQVCAAWNEVAKETADGAE